MAYNGSINNQDTLHLAYLQAETYGRMFHDKMDEAKRNHEMLQDLADAQKALSDWRACGSKADSDGNGKTVQQEAIEKLEALIAKYPDLKDDFAQGLSFAKKYVEGSKTDECNNTIDAMMKTVDSLKDANSKNDQLVMLELNDLHASHNRVALQASETMGANNQLLQSIIGNMRG
jgi:molecular chaperone GrpE (heat shock protein)